jgi:hypothetical protein
MDLEEVWRIREEEVYPSFFGQPTKGIYPLSHEIFSQRFRQNEIDPRWLTYGVIQFSPTETRNSWLYVTSGHSNPWEQEPHSYDPTSESGAGIEFVLMSTEQGDWAIRALQNMLAFDLLLGAGRFPNGKPLSFQDRIPLREPINGKSDCEIRNLILTEPKDIPREFALPSGKVMFGMFVGITDSELAFAKANGSHSVIDKLQQAGQYPATNPLRNSLV